MIVVSESCAYMQKALQAKNGLACNACAFEVVERCVVHCTFVSLPKNPIPQKQKTAVAKTEESFGERGEFAMLLFWFGMKKERENINANARIFVFQEKKKSGLAILSRSKSECNLK